MSPRDAKIVGMIVHAWFGAVIGLQVGSLINFVTVPNNSFIYATTLVIATVALVKGCRLIQYINSGAKHVN